MNETIQTILSRRSIRNYKTDVFSQDLLTQIVRAGLSAPSAGARYPYHILVVTGIENISEISQQVKEATARDLDNPYRKYVLKSEYTVNFKNAPVFIIVSADTAKSNRSARDDCALVLGTMFLAAYSLGIGSCWINQLNVLCDDSVFRGFITRLGIPPSNRIFGSACFGYSDGLAPQAPLREINNVTFVAETAYDRY